MKFKTGDIVRIRELRGVDEDFGRYVGEIGFVLGDDIEDYECEEDDEIVVQFPAKDGKYYASYFIYKEQLELVSPATLATIFYALNVDDKELLHRVTEFIETKR